MEPRRIELGEAWHMLRAAGLDRLAAGVVAMLWWAAGVAVDAE